MTTIGGAVRFLLTAGGVVVAAVLGLKILVLLVEPRLTFLPVPDLPATPEAYGLPFEEAVFETVDGVELHGWHIPGRRSDPAHAPLTLLHFHGNAENIAYLLPLAELTREAGYDLLLLDYRGYGRSRGRPSEAGIYRDGEAALEYLRRRGVTPDRVVLWGRSLGAAVAVDLASGENRPAGVVLESAFTSVRELLREGGGLVLYPLSFLSTYRFDQAGKIGRVKAPLLFVHGTDDEVVPYHLGRRLFDLAPGSREFLSIEGGGHNDLLARHREELWEGVRRFLESLR